LILIISAAQVNHGYRLTDALAARVAELEKEVKKAGVPSAPTAPFPPTAAPGGGMAPGRLQDAVQAAANAEAATEALQTRLDDALGPLTANYQMLAEAVAAWDGVAPQAAAAKQLLASPEAGPSAEALTGRVMDVERAMEELKQQEFANTAWAFAVHKSQVRAGNVACVCLSGFLFVCLSLCLFVCPSVGLVVLFHLLGEDRAIQVIFPADAPCRRQAYLLTYCLQIPARHQEAGRRQRVSPSTLLLS
jgi:hypothetical protein